MTTIRNLLLAATALSLLTACQPGMGQNQYNYTEVGKSSVVVFGTVVNAREVDVRGFNSGTGGLAGGVAGGMAGNTIGNGNGQVGAAIAGAVIGLALGTIAEQQAANYRGMEYTVTREDGKTITNVQTINKGDVIFKSGDRVMVQMSGSYQRVLPTDNIPTQIKRPKGIKLID